MVQVPKEPQDHHPQTPTTKNKKTVDTVLFMHFVCSWERLPAPLVYHDLLAPRYQLPNNTLYYYGTIYLLFIPLSLGPTCYPFWATFNCGVLVCPRGPPYFQTRNKESPQKITTL